MLDFSHSVTADEKSERDDERKPETYGEVVSYSLEKSSTDDISAEYMAKIVNFKRPTGMSAVLYLEVFWKNTPMWPHIRRVRV